MCGIWAVFGLARNTAYHCRCAMEISHRGPDSFRMESIPGFKHCYLAFFRLAIVGDSSGMQPLNIPSMPHIYVMYNGEIYNYKSLAKKYGFDYHTSSDGEAILQLYARFGAKKTAELLDGVFAFILVDTMKKEVHLGRDTFGVRPLFMLKSDEGRCYGLSSEMKGLIQMKKDLKTKHHVSIEHVLPGHYCLLSLQSNGVARIVDVTPYTSITSPPVFDTDVKRTSDVKENVKRYLMDAVRKRLMGNRRVGCLLSGGLDSSLVTALAVKFMREQGSPYSVQTFCVGMEGSEDLKAARKVADYLKTEHHEISFKADEAIKQIPTVIKHLEGYDNSTIRGSVCLFLVCKYIRENTDTVVLLSGEGADELAQGYEYFQHAPSAEDADEESKRLLRNIYLYDVLRVDRCTAAHGLELRVPMLDKAFTSYFLSLPAEMRRPREGTEKFLLRSCFEKDELIPEEVLWRKKAAMPDGVSASRKGASWLETLQNHFSKTVKDDEFVTAATKYPFNAPRSKQAYFYRKIFEGHFPGQYQATPRMWTLKWMGVEDPSVWTIQHRHNHSEVLTA